MKVIITGASQGIGAEIARKLGALGYHCLLLARNEAKLKQVAKEIAENGGKVTIFVCDVSKETEVEAFFAHIFAKYQELPLLLVNNAGYGGAYQRADVVSTQTWEDIFAVNVTSAFFFCRKLLPVMQKANFGRIINIASIYGHLGGAYSTTYTAAKHALVGYTKALAVEWGKFGITVNAISPGYIETEMTVKQQENQKLLQQIPAQKMGKTSDIADLVAFLLKAETSYLNGENMVIDGGLSAGFDFL